MTDVAVFTCPENECDVTISADGVTAGDEFVVAVVEHELDHELRELHAQFAGSEWVAAGWPVP